MLLFTVYWLLVTGYWLLVTGYWLLVTAIARYAFHGVEAGAKIE